MRKLIQIHRRLKQPMYLVLASLFSLMTLLATAAPLLAESTSVTWTTQQDVEQNFVTTGDATTKINLDTVTAPGDVRIVAQPTGPLFKNPKSSVQGVYNPIENKTYTVSDSFGYVYVIDGTSNQMVNMWTGIDISKGVAWNSKNNKLYVSEYRQNRVTIFDCETEKIIGTVAVGKQPIGVVYNSADNKIYVANQMDGTVSIIDGSSNSLVGTVTTGGNPLRLAYNSTQDQVYVANYGYDSYPFASVLHDYVTVIDGKTDQIVQTVTVGAGPADITFNPLRNVMYVAVGSVVKLLDCASGQIINSVPASSRGVHGTMGYNTKNNKLYVGSGLWDAFYMFEYDGVTDQLIKTTTTLGTPLGIFYANAVNKVYALVYTYGFWSSSSTVSIFDGATDAPLADLKASYESATKQPYPSVATIGSVNLGNVGLRAKSGADTDAVWTALKWNYDAVPGQSLLFQLRTAQDTASLAAATYAGPDGTSNTWYKAGIPGAVTVQEEDGTYSTSVPLATASIVPNAFFSRYAEAKVKLVSDGTATPVLHSVTLESNPPATAAVALSNLTQAYDGTAKAATATTTPAGLPVKITYNGSTAIPIEPGTYEVVAGVLPNYLNYQGNATNTLHITNASIVLSNLVQRYDRNGKAVIATTVPANLPVQITYNGSLTPPTAIGTYAVVATVNASGYHAIASDTLSIIKGIASIALNGLDQTYDGTSRIVTATTTPADLSVVITYKEQDAAPTTTPPTNAGDYAISATIDDANFDGSAAGTLKVAKAAATIAIAGDKQIYDEQRKTLTATTNPAGLPVEITFSTAGSPTNPGSYPFVATVNHANYQGTLSGTLVIAVKVSLGNLHQFYDGKEKRVEVTTSPNAVPVVVTYSGLTNGGATYNSSSTAPTEAGSYTVVAKVADPNLQGEANGTLDIAKADQAISLSALSSSGLPVKLTVQGDNAMLNGSTLIFTGPGTVVVTVTQGGDDNYNPTADILGTFQITNP